MSKWRQTVGGLWIISLVLSVLPCLSVQDGSTLASERDRLSVLFVGNSLTYTNDLPGMVEKILESQGVEVSVDTVAGPNLGLPDHWESKRVRRRVGSGDWDFVVFQQGPSATEGRPSLLDYSARFSALVREGGGEPVLYMVWPSARRSFDFPGVSKSYSMAAKQNGARLARAGDAWRVAWQIDPEFRLYGADGFHPSYLGSYLSALVLSETLLGSAVDVSELKARRVEPVAWPILERAMIEVRGSWANLDEVVDRSDETPESK